MILTAKRTKVVTENFTVPDFYNGDDTPRGRIVDALIAPFRHRDRTARNRLYDVDADIVGAAVADLKIAYDTATSIMRALALYGFEIVEQKNPVPQRSVRDIEAEDEAAERIGMVPRGGGRQ